MPGLGIKQGPFGLPGGAPAEPDQLGQAHLLRGEYLHTYFGILLYERFVFITHLFI